MGADDKSRGLAPVVGSFVTKQTIPSTLANDGRLKVTIPRLERGIGRYSAEVAENEEEQLCQESN